MILTVDEFRSYYQTDETDDVLKSKLTAIELMIRAFTNNSFQERGFRQVMSISGQTFVGESVMPYKAGDTVQVTKSQWHDGLYTVDTVNGRTITVREDITGEDSGLVTKVVYPADVIMGVVNLMKWELERRDKVGISSETLSRHSVTYADMNNGNTLVGYPKMLISFLFPYKRARFGAGAAE